MTNMCPRCCRSLDTASAVCPCENEPPAPRPYTCPTCSGHKIVSRPPWVPGDAESWHSTGVGTYPCQSCGATGIVWGPPAQTPTVVLTSTVTFLEPDP